MKKIVGLLCVVLISACGASSSSTRQGSAAPVFHKKRASELLPAHALAYVHLDHAKLRAAQQYDTLLSVARMAGAWKLSDAQTGLLFKHCDRIAIAVFDASHGWLSQNNLTFLWGHALAPRDVQSMLGSFEPVNTSAQIQWSKTNGRWVATVAGSEVSARQLDQTLWVVGPARDIDRLVKLTSESKYPSLEQDTKYSKLLPAVNFDESRLALLASDTKVLHLGPSARLPAWVHDIQASGLEITPIGDQEVATRVYLQPLKSSAPALRQQVGQTLSSLSQHWVLRLSGLSNVIRKVQTSEDPPGLVQANLVLRDEDWRKLVASWSHTRS